MLRPLVLFVLAVCLAYPAWGEEAAKKGGKPEPGTSVDIRLMAPMSQDGTLLGYAYITSKLVCSSPVACIAVREKFAFVQDAFVRELHAKPVGLASDPKEVDKDQLAVRLTAVAKRVVGSDKVQTMLFPEIKFAPLHPSDSTMPAPAPGESPAGTAPEGSGKPGEAAKTASSQGATSKPASGPSH